MAHYKTLLENTKQWNLENDTQSFGMIETFAQNFLNKIDFVKSELTKTEYFLNESQNDVSHLFSRLQNLSTNRFVENTVNPIDFSRQPDQKPELPKAEIMRTQEVVIELFKNSLQNGINALNLSQVIAGNANKEEELSRSDTIRNEAISIANFNYMNDKANRLPYIYGTKQFFTTECIGLIDKNAAEGSDEKEFGTIAKEEREKLLELDKSKTMEQKNQQKVEKNEKEQPQIQNKNTQKPSTTDSQVAFLKDADPNRKTTNSMNVSVPIINLTNNLPPPPPPPPLNILLTNQQTVKKPEPVKPATEEKKEENTLNTTGVIQPPQLSQPAEQNKVENKPMDLMEEIRMKQAALKKKKEEASLGIKPEEIPRKISAPVQNPREEPKNQLPKKSADEILDKSENLSNSIEVPMRSSSEFQSNTSKIDFSTINKKRLNIKETQNLFDENPHEDEDEDSIFKNSTKKPLDQIFKPVDFSPVGVNPSSIIKERPNEEEESPKKTNILHSRPSMRKQDFDLIEEKNQLQLPVIVGVGPNSNNAPNINKNDRLKGLFMDSDEEKSEETQKLTGFRENEKDGIVLRSMRKSHTIKQKEEEEKKSSSVVIDHDISMNKPPAIRKKKKTPTMFQDEDEEEESKIINEFKPSIPDPKTKIEEKEEKEIEHETFNFQKEKQEEEKHIVPLRLSTNNNSRKLEKLFDDEGDEEDSWVFNKPKKLDSGPKKKVLVFDDDDND